MSSKSSTQRTRSYGHIGVRMCYCGQVASITTSWSDRNPDRRYYHCPILNGRERACRYFDWAEPRTESSMPETSRAGTNTGRNDTGTDINDALQQPGQIDNELGRLLVEHMRREELYLRLLKKSKHQSHHRRILYRRKRDSEPSPAQPSSLFHLEPGPKRSTYGQIMAIQKGIYPTQVIVYEVKELGLKFEWHLDSEIIDFQGSVRVHPHIYL